MMKIQTQWMVEFSNVRKNLYYRVLFSAQAHPKTVPNMVTNLTKELVQQQQEDLLLRGGLLNEKHTVFGRRLSFSMPMLIEVRDVLPKLGQVVKLFSDVKIQDLKASLGLN